MIVNIKPSKKDCKSANKSILTPIIQFPQESNNNKVLCTRNSTTVKEMTPYSSMGSFLHV